MRAFLYLCALALAACIALPARAVDYPPVVPGVPVELPRDHGAHPEHRVEWWYVTGWLEAEDNGERRPLGFQVTFFRVRPGVQETNPSRFAARQVLFAHVALSDPRTGRLLHDERTARAGFGLAGAATDALDVRLDRWRLTREPASQEISANIRAREFALALRFAPTQPALLQGEQGYSQKAPDPRNASYYYSLPQLAVSGEVETGGRRLKVSGRAWLDHEWSSEYLPAGADGWDWLGLNLADGGALMAFRMRGKDGQPLWSAATLRHADGRVERLRGEAVRLAPQRNWRSPRTGTAYPVEMRLALATAAGPREIELAPLMDDQELDSRGSTGAVYWEGAVRAREAGAEIGRGYLELTGYRGRLRM